MFYKILIQPAKSDRSACKNCHGKINKDTLRAKVIDARDFNQYIKRHGRENISGEGLSRGYFECAGPNGQHISIQKYFVHLECYVPIEPHPYEQQYFQLKWLSNKNKETFRKWLQDKINSLQSGQKKNRQQKDKNKKGNNSKTKTKTAQPTSKKTAKQSKTKKTKKISKKPSKTQKRK